MLFFDTIVKRVSNFSTQSYEENKDNLIDFFVKNDLFNLCILTASPSLYDDLLKSKQQKTIGALTNYFNRAHFNPTPFGVFNSVGILYWDETTNISKAQNLKLMVKHDNLFLALKKDESIADELTDLTFCTNPTVHFSNNGKISFYKSKNESNNIIEISYSELDEDDDLLWLLNQFKNGKKISLVIEDLVSQGFEKSEVIDFLTETIEAGLIIETFIFNSYADKLYNSPKKFLSKLVDQKEHLLKSKNDYAEFSAIYKNEQSVFLGKDNSLKNFYAVNSFDQETGTLNKSIQSKIKKYIDFAVQYNSQTTFINDNLDKFISKIKNLYNDGFVPLTTVFNPYSGISYNAVKTEKELKLHKDILSKILASKENNLTLNLSTDDNFEIKASKLPATFNVMLESLVCKATNKTVIYIHGMGDPSSLNIISRFSDITHTACQDIINFEKETHKDKIIADISCVANFRSINVAPTKQKYDYCIPINTAYSDTDNPIFLSDIYFHLNNNKVALVSKDYKKQILPKKVSAINQRLLDSDIYNFLCDFEMYNEEIYGVTFNFNAYKHHLQYIPRIYLDEDILLYPAQILLAYNDLTFNNFKDYLHEKITEHSFSNNVVFIDKQRKYVLDSKNDDHIKMLFDKIKFSKSLYVSEFIYESFTPQIQRNDENFAHELVVGVKNPYYKRENVDYSTMDISFQKSINPPIVSDWLYLELYCNNYADAEIFNVVYNDIIVENKAVQFFFVNYNIPERHIRLRFNTPSIENKQYIIKVIQDLNTRNIISKYHILPYEPEIHRYGGIEMMKVSEFIFDLDSRDFLLNIVKIEEKKNKEIVAVLKIKNYLKLFGFSLDDMIVNCESVIKNYSQEFELTPQLRKEFNKEYSLIKSEIDEFNYTDFLGSKEVRFHFADVWKKSSSMHLVPYAWLIIHMSINRHFNNNQRFNEFKMYYFAKCYFNQLKFKK